MLWYDHSVLDCLRYYFSTCALLLLILSTLLNVSDWISLAHLDHLWSVFCSSISYNFLEITYHQVPYHLLQVCTIIYKFSTILRYTLFLSISPSLSIGHLLRVLATFGIQKNSKCGKSRFRKYQAFAKPGNFCSDCSYCKCAFIIFS